MADIEERVTEVEKKQAVADAKFDAFMQSLNDFKQEMRDFKNEIRQQNEMRAKEIADIRAETDRKLEKIDERFDKMYSKIDSINHYAPQMFIAAAIGIAAMILTVVAPLIFSAFKAATAPEQTPAVQTQLDRASSSELQLKVPNE